MKLIEACDRGGSRQRENCIQHKCHSWQAHPPRSKPQQSHGPVAEEVPGLADVMVQDGPARIADVPEDMLPYPA